MTSKLSQRRIIYSLALSLLLTSLMSKFPASAANNNSNPAQEITGSNGDMFMEETTPPPRRSPNTKMNILNGSGSETAGNFGGSSNGNHTTSGASSRQQLQNITGSGNSDFMQEVETKPSGNQRRAYVDLSNVGIQVDPNGNMVPTIDHSGAPVRPLGSSLQVFNEMPVPTITPTYDNPYGLPYTIDGQPAAVGTAFVPVTPGSVPFLRPSFNPYNGMTTLNPYSAQPFYGNPYGGFGGFGGYGGYPGYGGFSGFGGGYGSPGINIGKLHIGIGGGYPGYGYPGYGYPGYGGGYPGGGYGYTGGGGGLLGGLLGNGLGNGFGTGYGSGFGNGFGNRFGNGSGYGPGSGFGNGFSSRPGFANNSIASPNIGVGGFGNGFGNGLGNALGGNPLGLQSPVQSTYATNSSSSSLMTPVLRDPKTSTGDILEDAKRSGLWGSTAGTGSGYNNQGLFGSSYGGSGEQHDTGVTNGSGLK